MSEGNFIPCSLVDEFDGDVVTPAGWLVTVVSRPTGLGGSYGTDPASWFGPAAAAAAVVGNASDGDAGVGTIGDRFASTATVGAHRCCSAGGA